MKRLLLLVLLFSSMSHAGEKLTVAGKYANDQMSQLNTEKAMPDAASKQILKLFPHLHIGEWTSGDLNQDGIADMTAFILSDTENPMNISVFLGKEESLF